MQIKNHSKATTTTTTTTKCKRKTKTDKQILKKKNDVL